MADELLNAIIQLEGQIQQQLQEEKARAEAWLSGVRREQAAILDAQRRKSAEQNERTLAEGKVAAEEDAKGLIAEELDFYSRLDALDDSILLNVLRSRLVPELLGERGE